MSLSSILCSAQESRLQDAGWHRQYSDTHQGSNIDAAIRSLRENKAGGADIIVGVVDSGIDTTALNVRSALWTNPGETADGRDNDGNGYADDLHGWNFLGNSDGTFNMLSAGTEEYRQFKALYPKYKTATPETVADSAEYAFYLEMRRKANINSYLTFYEYAKQKKDARMAMDSIFKSRNIGTDTLTIRGLSGLEVGDSNINNYVQMIMADLLRTSPETTWRKFNDDQDAALQLMNRRIEGIEKDQDKRLLIGDDLEDFDDIRYGNNNIAVEGCEHGTFVAGIIAGEGDGTEETRGIAAGIARVMGVRISPEGDEYDKDMASAIRYAADNGAKIINISLGKYYSPHPQKVNEAIEYAAKHDALVIQAAGNNRKDIDQTPYFPTGKDNDGKELPNFIRVGATDMNGDISAVSNYGKNNITLYAPGEYIVSSFGGDQFSLQQGTSVAAPVVSGIAAVIRSYYPDLTAAEVKDLLVRTARTKSTDKGYIKIVDMLEAVRKLDEYYVSAHWIEGDWLSYDIKKDGKTTKYAVNARNGQKTQYETKDDLKKIIPRKKTRKGNGRPWDFRNGRISADSLYSVMMADSVVAVKNNQTGEVAKTGFKGKASGQWRGHSYIEYVYDDSKVGELYIIDALKQPRPELITKKMPLPGEKNVRQFAAYWYNADTKEGRMLDIGKFKDQKVEWGYGKSESEIWFTRRSRSADTIQLCRIDAKTGEVSVVISEECKPHLSVNLFNYRLINNDKEIIWWSERTGRGNYYLYDRDGKLKGRITSGDNLVAGRIEHIDTLKRQIVFIGYGNETGSDPYYAYYYKVSLDGKRQQLLSHGNGTHTLRMNDDCTYAIDEYSRMDMPGVINVVSVKNPSKYFELGRTDTAEVIRRGWRKPTLIKVKAADNNTDLYGLMFTPKDMDPKKKYPIISNVYPGPQDDQITRSFARDDNGNQTLADDGFIVINVAPRGSSPYRGRDFLAYGYGNLRDYPLADDRYAITQLAAKYSFIDTTRVGIYGHSGGGMQTVTAMLTYPDFYKVGVAASGNYDNNIYIQWWGETWHGTTPIPTPMTLAKNLKGRLLLLSGDMDQNVPWASTLRMARALIDAGKRFDMMVLPGEDHGYGGKAGDYYEKMVRHYFIDNLVRPEERDDNINNF